MFVRRVPVARAPRCSFRAQPAMSETPRRRASTAVATGSKATLPTDSEHLSKLQKALETGDAKAVVEVADALNKLSSSLSQDQRAALQKAAAEDLKSVAEEDPSVAEVLKKHTLPHEQLLAALPEWHNPRGYEINSVEDLEHHWHKWVSKKFPGVEARMQKLYADGGADANKTELQLFDFLTGLSKVSTQEEALDFFKKNLPEFLEQPYVLGQPNPFYTGPPVGMQPKDQQWNRRISNQPQKRAHIFWDFMSGYFQNLVDDGAVNPAVLKQMYSLDLALAQRSPEAVQLLKEECEVAFRAAAQRFRNPAKVDEVYSELSQRVDEVANGVATVDSFRMTSLNGDKVQDRYEDLIKNHATFKNLDWETKLHIARTYNLSLGYQTLEWTWPSPPPAHTWVELPVYKPVDDGHHHGHKH